MMRNSLLKVLSQNYIRTAYSKGLTKFQIIKDHAIKNSLNPVITALSGWFASMLAGSVFVEYITKEATTITLFVNIICLLGICRLWCV